MDEGIMRLSSLSLLFRGRFSVGRLSCCIPPAHTETHVLRMKIGSVRLCASETL